MDNIQIESWKYFTIILAFLLSVLLVYVVITRTAHYVPESVAVMFLGMLVGVCTKYVSYAVPSIHQYMIFESLKADTFFLMLLPPILFESGYNLKKGDFFSNLGAILSLAVVGTALSTVIIGFIVYFVTVKGWTHIDVPVNISDAITFGALLSSTDPVSTLSIFQALNVDEDLFTIVLGESVLNDVVPIALVQTMKSVAVQPGSAGGGLTAKLFWSFFECITLSSFIGIIFALMGSLLLKHVNVRKFPSLELILIGLFAYMPYSLSQALGLSGVVAILLTGIVMSHYMHHNLSPMTQITVQQSLRTVSFIAETLVFLFMGCSLFTHQYEWNVRLLFWALFACLVARLVCILLLSLVMNVCRGNKPQLSLKLMFLLWFSGLRGAVAFALSLELPFPIGKLCMSSTLGISMITNIVMGFSMVPIIKVMKLNKRTDADDVYRTVSRTDCMVGYCCSLRRNPICGCFRSTKSITTYKSSLLICSVQHMGAPTSVLHPNKEG